MKSNLALFDTSRSNIFIRQFRLYGDINDLFYYEKILKLKSKNKNQDLKPDQINEIKKMIKLIK